jgi:hypothetical protein
MPPLDDPRNGGKRSPQAADGGERSERPAAAAPGLSLAIRLLRRLPRPLGGLEAAEIMGARTADLRTLPRVPKAFTVRPAEVGDAPLLDRFFNDPARTRRRLSSIDDCLLAVGDGQIHAIEWVRWGPAEYAEDECRLGVRFKVPARAVWLHDGGNVAPDRVGPWGIVMGRLRPFLERRGVDRVFLQVDPTDPYSVACHASLGFQRVGRLVALRALRVRLLGFRVGREPWARVSGELDLGRLRV